MRKQALYDLSFSTTVLVRHKHKDETGIVDFNDYENPLVQYMLDKGDEEKTFIDWGWGLQYRLVLKFAYAGAKVRFEIEVILPQGKEKEDYELLRDKSLAPYGSAKLITGTGKMGYLCSIPQALAWLPPKRP